MSNDWTNFWIGMGFIFMIAIFLIFPILEIWALNTLFNLEIANWKWDTYGAMMVLNFVVGSGKFIKKG